MFLINIQGTNQLHVRDNEYEESCFIFFNYLNTIIFAYHKLKFIAIPLTISKQAILK